MCVHLLENVPRQRLARLHEKDLMERIIVFEQCFVVFHGGRRKLLLNEFVQLLELVKAGLREERLEHRRFQTFAHEALLCRAAHVDAGHGRFALRQAEHQSVTLEPDERFPHRRTADFQLTRQFLRAHRCSRRKIQVQYLRPQCQIDLILHTVSNLHGIPPVFVQLFDTDMLPYFFTLHKRSGIYNFMRIFGVYSDILTDYPNVFCNAGLQIVSSGLQY